MTIWVVVITNAFWTRLQDEKCAKFREEFLWRVLWRVLMTRYLPTMGSETLLRLQSVLSCQLKSEWGQISRLHWQVHLRTICRDYYSLNIWLWIFVLDRVSHEVPQERILSCSICMKKRIACFAGLGAHKSVYQIQRNMGVTVLYKTTYTVWDSLTLDWIIGFLELDPIVMIRNHRGDSLNSTIVRHYNKEERGWVQQRDRDLSPNDTI